MPTITPFLWFPDKVEEATRFYVSLLPNSRVDSITVMAGDNPSGPEGAVIVVEFTLAGRPYMAMQAGPLDAFNHAVSLMVECETQEEIDRLWAVLLDGGSAEPCGWLKDRYGLSWQITPRVLQEMAKSSDRAAARRVNAAMLKMSKLEIAPLQKAFDGG